MPRKRKRASRRTVYWAWPSHLESGRMMLLETKRQPNVNCARPMVRVRVTKI